MSPQFILGVSVHALLPKPQKAAQDRQGVHRTVVLTFFRVRTALRHLVRHVSQTKNFATFRLCECIQRSSLHSLYGLLKQADPALVDPGVTAQLECLLDDVVAGKQEMIGAINAVCNVAQRIIDKLKEGAAKGGLPSFSSVDGNSTGSYPPSAGMKRCADSLVRNKRIKPPAGYKTSISICRKFLQEHAPKKTDEEATGTTGTKPVSAAQLLYAKKIAQGKGLIIPNDAKASVAAMSAWIEVNRDPKRKTRSRKVSHNTAGSVATRAKMPTKRAQNVKRATMLMRRLLPSQILASPRRHCGYLLATRTSRSSLAPDIALLDGMPHLALISPHSTSADGYEP